MVQDKARMEKTPCFEPFLSSGKAHIVEGDFRTREHYERAWSVAGAGIRSGDVDVVRAVGRSTLRRPSMSSLGRA